MTFTLALRRALGYATLLLAVGALSGCSDVYTVEPVGDTPVTLDPAAWDGYWAEITETELCGENGAGPRDPRDGEVGCFHLKVVDPANGMLSIEWPGPAHVVTPGWVRGSVVGSHGTNEPSDGKSWTTGRKPLRTHDYAEFLTWSGEEGTGQFRTAWARVLKGQNSLVLWLPDHGAFGALIDAGVLPGERLQGEGVEGDLQLNQLDGQALATITGDLAWDLFDWENPIVLVRVRADADTSTSEAARRSRFAGW